MIVSWRSGADRQAQFDNAALLLGEALPAGSVYRLLPEHGLRLFGDDYFADVFTGSRLRRPTVPARVVATVMLLQAHEGLGREACDQLAFLAIKIKISQDGARHNPSVELLDVDLNANPVTVVCFRCHATAQWRRIIFVISDQDMYFHPATSDHYTWAETNYFGFYLSEARVHVGAYVQAKPNLGAVLSSVSIFDGVSNTPHEVNYFDCHVHLPMPKGNLDDFELANGLAIRCTKPVMNYEIRFDGELGVSFEVAYTGLMPPYDIHDPSMDPLADAQLEGDTVSAHAYAGHWDQSGRVRGMLNLRGRQYPIDCVSSMDHSWGLRDERSLKNFCWMNANFDDDMSIHCIWLVDPQRLDRYPAIAHGYVREGERVYGIREGSGTLVRNGYLHQFFDLRVEDVRGTVHEFTGTPMTANPWIPWPQMYLSHAFVRWDRRGVTGWGEVQDLCKEDFNAKRAA